ncbi:MAG: hypothetical protein ACI9FU_001907 [Granulosicoccus sp.]|jgi:hypothetical protein
MMDIANRRPLIFGIASTGILLIPLIGMQFTSEVNWNAADFIVAAALLFGIGTVLELTLRTIKKKRHRIVAVVVLLLSLCLVWAELAVGLFGSPLAGS